MKTYARNVNNVATDVTTTDPATIFHPDIAAQFVVVPNGTVNGATFASGTWTNPVSVPPTPATPVYELLTPMTLYMAFKPQERIAIKSSTDPLVIEFWAMYQLSVQLDKPTDPNLVSVQNALNYLAQPKNGTPAGAGILESRARVDQILAGIPQ